MPDARMGALILAAPVAVAGLMVLSAVLSGAFGWAGLAAVGLCLAVVWSVVTASICKYPALFLCWSIWHVILVFGLGWMAEWAGLVLFGVGSLLISILAASLGKSWGAARYLALARRGRGIQEWEWVYVGACFARAHLLFRLSPGIWLVCGVLLLTGLWVWLRWGAEAPSLAMMQILFLLVTIGVVMRCHPAAYPMVFPGLGLGFPLTAPFMFYWADGMRPNLIYRHRFERLRPEETCNV